MKPLAFALATALVFARPAGGTDSLDKVSLSAYGVGHISYDLNDDGDTTDDTIASNSSRLGFRGSVELNHELGIVAQYESGVDLTVRGTNDGNGGTDSGDWLVTKARDWFAGLHHEHYGELVIGRVGALNQYVYDYNLFADQIGDLGNLWATHGLFGRIDEALQYTSPNFFGFGFRGIIAPGSGEDDNDVYVIKGDYESHGFRAGITYLNQGQVIAGESDHWSFAVTSSYTFGGGQYSVGGGYQREFNANGIGENNFNSATLGGSTKLSNGILKAQLGWMDDGSVPDTGVVTWAVGYDYNFRDDTTIYIAYSGVSNDDSATVSANNYGHGQAESTAPGKDPWSVSLGLVYKFDLGL